MLTREIYHFSYKIQLLPSLQSTRCAQNLFQTLTLDTKIYSCLGRMRSNILFCFFLLQYCYFHFLFKFCFRLSCFSLFFLLIVFLYYTFLVFSLLSFLLIFTFQILFLLSSSFFSLFLFLTS